MFVDIHQDVAEEKSKRIQVSQVSGIGTVRVMRHESFVVAPDLLLCCLQADMVIQHTRNGKTHHTAILYTLLPQYS